MGEVISCPSAKLLDKINFCFLDVQDFERIQRLRKRGSPDVDQNTLNWSSWLRMHTCDPTWKTHIIQEAASCIMDFTQLNSISNYNGVADILTIDTTDYKSIKVAKYIVN